MLLDFKLVLYKKMAKQILTTPLNIIDLYDHVTFSYLLPAFVAPFAMSCSYSSEVGGPCTVHSSDYSRGKLQLFLRLGSFY